MTPFPVSPPVARHQSGDASLTTVKEEKSSVPLWVIGIILFLIALIFGMGGYIAYTQGLFQKKIPAALTETPTPTSAAAAPSRMIPTADWLTYRDDSTGFQLNYPPTVLLNVPGKGVTQPILSISVASLDSLPDDLPLGMGKTDALADRAALEKGVAKTTGDFAASDALVRIGNTYNGRMTSVLSRFEVCSVLFSRTLVFYPNNYRVMISLSGDKEAIMASMPEFFTTDPTNCSDQKVWNRDLMGTFMPTLAKGAGKGAGQTWYDTFDAIIKTIQLIPVHASVQPTTGATATPTQANCEVSDRAFCNVLADIKNSMAAKNYVGVIAYQTPTSVTCDPDGMFVAICDGQAKGVVKEGYALGYNQSEGSIQTRDNHLASLSSYIAASGPFTYQGSLVSGDKAVIVYLNNDKTKLLVFRLTRTGATWRFSTILVGGTFGDQSFATVSPSLLQ